MTHYFTKDPKTEHRYRLLEEEFEGKAFKFRTDSGVFSAHKIDTGSKLLLQTVLDEEELKEGSLLDLGCGYGVISIIMRRLRPKMKIIGSDVNRRALELAAYNLKLNNLSSVDFVESDGLANLKDKFDLILSNPPIRAGKKIILRLFKESYLALNEPGRLYLVIRKKQGAASTFKELQTLFAEAKIVRKKSGYWIICCCKA